MKTIRSFIAVEIGQPHRQRISGLISCLRASGASVRWINENQMHLTLKFLGNIAENEVRQISGVLESIARGFGGFKIRFSKIGAFPDIRRPRVIWIGIDKGGEDLKHLRNKIQNGLKDTGSSQERREYKPHLTIGRIKGLKNISNLENLITGSVDLRGWGETEIDRLVLFRSTLSSAGAIYTSISESYLDGPNSVKISRPPV